MERGKIVYLSGRITDNDHYASAESFLIDMGYIVFNPTKILKDLGELSCEQSMYIRYRLVDIADIIFMVSGWQKSKGANAELSYAKSLGKEVKYQDYYAPFRKGSDDEARDSN